MMGYGWNGGMGAAGWIGTSLFWIVVVGLVVWAISRAVPTTGRREPQPETPEQILDRRFAAGKLGAEEYQQARAQLTAGRGAG